MTKNVQRTKFKTLDNFPLQPFQYARLDSCISKAIRHATCVKIHLPHTPKLPSPPNQ